MIPSPAVLICLWMPYLLTGTDCSPDLCAGVKCEPLTHCYMSSLKAACCPRCLSPGCDCPDYYLEDCLLFGYKKGVMPLGSLFYRDFGSRVCTCESRGNITCKRIPCPAISPDCKRVVTPMDSACPQCICSSDGYGAVPAGTVFTDNCQQCVCPTTGGELSCTTDPPCPAPLTTTTLPLDSIYGASSVAHLHVDPAVAGSAAPPPHVGPSVAGSVAPLHVDLSVAGSAAPPPHVGPSVDGSVAPPLHVDQSIVGSGSPLHIDPSDSVAPPPHVDPSIDAAPPLQINISVLGSPAPALLLVSIDGSDLPPLLLNTTINGRVYSWKIFLRLVQDMEGQPAMESYIVEGSG